jgi:hypothetical protein
MALIDETYMKLRLRSKKSAAISGANTGDIPTSPSLLATSLEKLGTTPVSLATSSVKQPTFASVQANPTLPQQLSAQRISDGHELQKDDGKQVIFDATPATKKTKTTPPTIRLASAMAKPATPPVPLATTSSTLPTPATPVVTSPSGQENPRLLRQPSAKGRTNGGQKLFSDAENQIIFHTTPTTKGANTSNGKSCQARSPVFDATPTSNKVSPSSGKDCTYFHGSGPIFDTTPTGNESASSRGFCLEPFLETAPRFDITPATLQRTPSIQATKTSHVPPLVSDEGNLMKPQQQKTIFQSTIPTRQTSPPPSPFDKKHLELSQDDVFPSIMKGTPISFKVRQPTSQPVS